MTQLLINPQNHSILQAQGGDGGALGVLFPIILIVVVFYFFMILPQTRKNKKAKKFLEELRKNDKVVTAGGIHGKIISISDKTVTMQCEGETTFVIEKTGISAELSEAANKS